MPHIVIRIDSSVPFWRSVRQSQLNVIVLGAVGIGCVLFAEP